jgi:hypothetical protein
MTATATTATGTLKFRRSEFPAVEGWTRYDLVLDDVKVGWLDRHAPGADWTAHALVTESSYKAEKVGTASRRSDAAFEVLLALLHRDVTAPGGEYIYMRRSAELALDREAHRAGR